MTIDEAIDSEKRIQKIKELEDKVTGIKSTNPQYHKQIVEWLEELKTYKEYGVINKESFDKGYDKAIEDCKYNTELFREIFLENLFADCYDIQERENIKAICKESWIMYQEQLKGGVQNG